MEPVSGQCGLAHPLLRLGLAVERQDEVGVANVPEGLVARGVQLNALLELLHCLKRGAWLEGIGMRAFARGWDCGLRPVEEGNEGRGKEGKNGSLTAWPLLYFNLPKKQET